ncbi:hypothetical protein [Natronomonas marina]|uniref:hypothetical protein n=1 Tax=Natronomonas marina TaxID=2961939 RepID=UPI0020CA1276|nr:hypothetical protein [Natronomonas marina]
MSSSFRDPTGTAGAFLAGVAGGLALSAPMLPGRAAVPTPELALGPVGGYLLVGVLVMTALPLCIALLYVVSIQIDN